MTDETAQVCAACNNLGDVYISTTEGGKMTFCSCDAGKVARVRKAIADKLKEPCFQSTTEYLTPPSETCTYAWCGLGRYCSLAHLPSGVSEALIADCEGKIESECGEGSHQATEVERLREVIETAAHRLQSASYGQDTAHRRDLVRKWADETRAALYSTKDQPHDA